MGIHDLGFDGLGLHHKLSGDKSYKYNVASVGKHTSLAVGSVGSMDCRSTL